MSWAGCVSTKWLLKVFNDPYLYVPPRGRRAEGAVQDEAGRAVVVARWRAATKGKVFEVEQTQRRRRRLQTNSNRSLLDNTPHTS